jgi:hypothetical protein
MISSRFAYAVIVASVIFYGYSMWGLYAVAKNDCLWCKYSLFLLYFPSSMVLYIFPLFGFMLCLFQWPVLVVLLIKLKRDN